MGCRRSHRGRIWVSSVGLSAPRRSLLGRSKRRRVGLLFWSDFCSTASLAYGRWFLAHSLSGDSLILAKISGGLERVCLGGCVGCSVFGNDDDGEGRRL